MTPQPCQAELHLVEEVVTLQASGGRVDWSPQGDLIAFDMAGTDGAYDVHVMKPDGSDVQCLTCDVAGLDPARC